MNNFGIRSIFEELVSNEQRDVDGDFCCRVHIKTASRLLIGAYNKGVSNA